MRTIHLSPLFLLLAPLGNACRATEDLHPAWAESPPAAPAVIVSWTGADAERDTPAFFPLTNAKEFEAMWTDVVIRLGSSRWPTDHLRPRVDFAECIGFALAAGATWNTRGYEVRAIEPIAGAWHVRLAPITYQSHGEGDRVRPYGIFLLTRVPGATLVVEEDVRDLIDAPPQWKERGRITVPKLGAAPATPPADALVPIAPPETQRFAERVLAAVRGYERFERVSDLPAWSPFYCRAPPAPGALVSHSGDGGTHGSKLYHLFAKDAAAYDACAVDRMASPAAGHAPSDPVSPAPVGQVLVKQAWEPVPVADAAPVADATRVTPADPGAKGRFGLREDVATRDGQLYRRGRQLELFVLLKLDPATPETDQGWVYATVTPDLKQVTAAGRIQSCMECHQDAQHDRQFGLPSDWVGMREPPR